MSTDVFLDDREILGKEVNMEELTHAYKLIDTDFAQARLELEGLANRGSLMAMVYLAYAFKHPNIADAKEAEKWLTKAYEGGSASALLNLAKMKYRAGAFQETERLWMDGASKGDGPSIFWLSLLYHTHPELDRRNMSRELLERAADLGQLRAMQRLAMLKIKGKYGIMRIPDGIWSLIKGFVNSFWVACHDPSSRRLW